VRATMDYHAGPSQADRLAERLSGGATAASGRFPPTLPIREARPFSLRPPPVAPLLSRARCEMIISLTAMTNLSVNKLLGLLSRIAHALEVIAKKFAPNFKPQPKPEPAVKPDHTGRAL
jgi:hypothetical protein